MHVNAVAEFDAQHEGTFEDRSANTMLYWALVFLIVGLIAGVLGFSGIAGTATDIAWILFVVGLILALIFAVVGRRPRL
jgi:uncharacterized membrane protein YtjA (UPF0391 family)